MLSGRVVVWLKVKSSLSFSNKITHTQQHLPEFQVTILTVEGKVCDINLTRASEYGGRIPHDIAVVANFGLCHDRDGKITLSTVDLVCSQRGRRGPNSDFREK